MLPKEINIAKVIFKILELIIIKPLSLPYKIYKNSLMTLSNSNAEDSEESNLSTEFPLYIWLVNIFDAIIALTYPLGILGAFIAGINAPYKGFSIFIGVLIASYFYPLALGLIREMIQVSLKVLLYLKIISTK